MRLHLLSDLHLELLHAPPALPALEVDVVIVAGDIGTEASGMDWAAETFSAWPGPPKIVYIAGNHEYYGSHLGLLRELRKPARKRRGVHLLERNVLSLPGVRILGCTLWSGFDLYGADERNAAISAAGRGINDYRLIRTRAGEILAPRDTLALHRKSVRWLDAELSEPFDGRTIVATHFAPHRGCVAPQHRDSDVSPYFVTDLAWLMEKHRIDVWCHGHTHTNDDFVAENGCRVISNQWGYANEIAAGNMGFRSDLVIEV